MHDHLNLATIVAAMPPPTACAPIATCMTAYLTATAAQVQPLYAMWTSGDFARADPPAVTFATARVAAGAGELRDMIVAAWRASRDATVGYRPEISVRAAEAGGPFPIEALYGSD